MLKILQARLQQYINCELPDVQVGFRKGRGTRDQIANICWIIEKATEFRKNIDFCFIDYAKAFVCPLDCKEIQPVSPKGNQSWIFIGRTDAEAPILWPPDAKKWLNWKDPDAGKDWGQKEKGNTGDEMVGWHHQLDGHDFEQALGFGDGQKSLACYSLWGHKELDTTEGLNWTELMYNFKRNPHCFPMCISTNDVRELWMFHIFVNSWYCQHFWF